MPHAIQITGRRSPIASTPDNEVSDSIARYDRDVDDPRELWPAIYDELHAVASRSLRRHGGRGAILQTTAVVHEAYLRLLEQNRVTWNDRNHYLSIAAITVRRILVDWARSEKRVKRGGGTQRVHLDEATGTTTADPLSFLALNDALERLAAWSELAGRVVELRFFAGLQIKEVAEVLEISPRKVDQEWAFARSWLHRELSEKA